MPPDALTADLLTVWRSHQSADQNLRGPFFSPEYFQIAGAVLPEVTVAVIEQPGQMPAFLPFFRDRASVARPVGSRACDFSGIIAAPSFTWSPETVIRACGLAGWDFTNVVSPQPAMDPYFRAFADSPYVDLSRGFDAFAKERGRGGSELVRQVGQKTRKLEREVAPMRFEPHVVDRHALECLYEWKAAQRERTGTFDVLSTPWMRQMVERMLAINDPLFAGVLSVVYAGDRVAAVHLGIRSDTVWHYWFAAYNRDLQVYSPGLIILLEMVRSAPKLGIDMMTLGQGDEPYKLRFATGSTTLGAGSVDCRLSRRFTNAIWYAARRASRQSTMMGRLARSVKRRSRWMFQSTQQQ
jgi:CelD/BcsL family acetyltransferase involved in cellulose biosynthesis